MQNLESCGDNSHIAIHEFDTDLNVISAAALCSMRKKFQDKIKRVAGHVIDATVGSLNSRYCGLH